MLQLFLERAGRNLKQGEWNIVKFEIQAHSGKCKRARFKDKLKCYAFPVVNSTGVKCLEIRTVEKYLSFFRKYMI